MKLRILFVLCLFTLCLPLTSASAYVQRTNIVTLVAPIHVPVTSQEPLLVSANVSYSGASPGYTLVVGVLDETNAQPTAVPSLVVASPNPCLDKFSLNAVCAVKLENISGSEYLQAKLGGILNTSKSSGTWNLVLSAILLDEKGNNVPNSLSSVPFQIDITPTPLLFVKVPSIVAVSVDGVTLPSGSIDGAPLTVGQHMLSVPNIVTVENGTRLKFDHWSDGSKSPSRSALAQSDVGLEAFYVTQHPLVVDSSIGAVSGAGWYNSNSNATFSVSTNYVPLNGLLGMIGSRLAFQGWYENGNLIASTSTATISMNQAHTLTASWQPDYTVPEMLTVVITLIIGAILVMTKHRHRTSSSKN